MVHRLARWPFKPERRVRLPYALPTIFLEYTKTQFLRRERGKNDGATMRLVRAAVSIGQPWSSLSLVLTYFIDYFVHPA